MNTALNPILLKELRQAVRSRFVSGALLFFLLGLLSVVAIVLLVNQERAVRNPTALFEMGSGAAIGVYIALATVGLLFLPAYTGIRMAFERGGEQLDLQYATTLAPARVVDGKMLACGAVFLQFAGVSLPFLVLSFMLRGVNLPGILLAFGFLTCATAWINYLALFTALLPLNRLLRILFALALAAFICFHLFLVITFSLEVLLEESFQIDWRDKDFWSATGFIAGATFTVCAMLRILSVSFLMPAASNRARPIRAWLTGFWILWGLLTAALAWLQREPDAFYAWILPFTVVAAVALVLAAAENPGYPRRVRREIPSESFRRLAFPFFSGAPSGVAWSFGIAAVTLGMGFGLEWATDFGIGAVCPNCGVPHDSGADSFELTSRALLGFLVVAGHAFTVRLLWRHWLHRVVQHGQLWALVLLSIAAGGLLPLLAQIGSEPEMTGRGLWQFGSLSAVFYEKVPLRPLLLKTGLWVLLAGFPFLRDFIRELRDFRRPAPGAPA